MKRGGLGGALLLAAAAIVALALNRAHSPARAPAPPPPVVEDPLPHDARPPEPPPTPAPEPPKREGPGARFVGRVTDDLGHPVADAGIWLTRGRGAGEGEIVARTAEDGRYLVDSVDGEERMVGAIAARHAPSDLRRIAPQTQPVFEIDFALRRGGGTLAIAIDSESADVFIEPVFLESAESGGCRRVEARGNVLVEGLVPEWNLVRVRTPGRAPQTLLARLPPEGVVDATVRLGPGAVVFGTARKADGTPASFARIHVVGWEWAEIAVLADVYGTYRLEHAPAAPVELRAWYPSGVARAFLDLSDGGEVRWDPVVYPARSIAGRVVDDGGAPVVEALVTCAPVVADLVRYPETTDVAGAFSFDGLPDAAYRIAAWRPGRRGPPSAEITTSPGAPPLDIVLPRSEGALVGLIATRAGAPAAGAALRTWRSGRPDYEKRARAGPDGSFRLEPLPAGSYFLELHLDGEPTIQRDGIEVKAGETLDLGVLRFAAGGRIRARVLDARGAPLPGHGAVVRSLDGTITYVVAQGDDACVSEELMPSRYLVSGGMAGVIEEVEVVAGETHDVDLRLRGGGTLDAAALHEDGSRAMATFRVRDERGRRVAVDEEPTESLHVTLASGAYTVDAVDESGRAGDGRVQIPADGTEVQLVLTLETDSSRR